MKIDCFLLDFHLHDNKGFFVNMKDFCHMKESEMEFYKISILNVEKKEPEIPYKFHFL
jgi:hypothetical protein